MSKADAKKFIGLLHTDDALRKSVHEAHDEILKLAKKKKLKVTRKELSDALKEHWVKGGGKDPNGDDCFVPLSEVPGF